MEITPKVRKAELSFLYAAIYATCCLILFYISTKYQQNIPEDIQVTEWTWNVFQIKQKVITPKVRKPELPIFMRHLSHPDLHFYQVSSKYSKGHSSYRVDKKFYAYAAAAANGIRPKTISPPLVEKIDKKWWVDNPKSTCITPDHDKNTCKVLKTVV